MDFDEWVLDQKNSLPRFYFVFNSLGAITGIYPQHAAQDLSNKIEIPDSLHNEILAGQLAVADLAIDILTHTILKKEKILHFKESNSFLRISDTQFSKEKNFEIYLNVDKNKSTVTVEASANLGGTRPDQGVRKILNFDENLVLKFYFTDYNDPNILYYIVEVKLINLLENKFSQKIGSLPENFAVFTRKIFEKYGFTVYENS